MKVAFIQAPAWGRDCPPYTMCYLAALVRQKGHQAYLFDLNNALYHTSPQFMRKMWDDKDHYAYWEHKEMVCALLELNNKIIDFLVERILNTDAKIIGFTVHFSSAWASLEIAKKIKERDKSRIIVFGGPDCSRQQKGDYFISQECVDVVVQGEGEGPLLEIMGCLKGLNHVEAIKGCLLLRNGRITDGGYVSGPEDLDSLPLPDYSDFKEDIIARTYKEPNRLDIFDSRSCPTRCHFCSEWQFWGKFRTKSGKKLYEEINYHIKNFPQVNYFYFAGSLLNGKIEELDDFCSLIISNKVSINWAGQAIIRTEMTRGLLQKMKTAGCAWLSYGVESGSKLVLEKMNKRVSLDTAARVLRDTHEAGISTQANFMFGLPTETREDFRKTLEFVKQNSQYMDTILASQSFCVIDKGTYLYNYPDEFGIRGRKHHLYWESNDGQNNYLERQRRYEEFCKLALSLGIPETSGVLRDKPDKWQLLGDYYFYQRDYHKAIEHYQKVSPQEYRNRTLCNKLASCYEETQDFNKAIEVLDNSLKFECFGSGYNGIANDSIKRKLSSLNELSLHFKDCANGSLDKGIKYYSLLESPKLSKILQHFSKINYRGIDLEAILSDFNFNEKQKSMSQALYSHGLWVKLSNYILADVQKARREALLFGYPYWLVIDPCNYCNLSCPFCPTGQKRDARTKGKLSLSDFKHILDKLGPYLIHIDLVNWGEPLLNENVPEMIRYAKNFNCDVKIDTNLLHLNGEKAEKLILSGLDKIVVSIDGLTEDTYSKYRIGGDFNCSMSNLTLLVNKRKALKKKSPYITWQFLVFRHNEHEINEALRIGKKLGVDHVGITKAFIGDKSWIPSDPQYSNYDVKRSGSTDLTYNYFKANNNQCNWPWEAIAINPNGSVSACCSVEDEGDDFGNIFDEPFEDSWNSHKYQTARSYIAGSNSVDKNNTNVCLKCKHAGLINIDILSCHSFFSSLAHEKIVV